VTPFEHNRNIPPNLKLLVGSQNLAIIDGELTRAKLTHGEKWTQEEQWKRVHSTLKHSLDSYAKSNKICVLIDTNPSFATYTAIGVATSTRLICPIKTDDSSRVALKNMLSLIHGPSQLQISFAAQAERMKIPLPSIFLCVSNQLKPREVMRNIRAHTEMVLLCLTRLREVAIENPTWFEHGACNSIERFKDCHFRELHDLNTMGVVSAHKGIPLASLGSKEMVGSQNIDLNRTNHRLKDGSSETGTKTFYLRELGNIVDIM